MLIQNLPSPTMFPCPSNRYSSLTLPPFQSFNRMVMLIWWVLPDGSVQSPTDGMVNEAPGFNGHMPWDEESVDLYHAPSSNSTCESLVSVVLSTNWR